MYRGSTILCALLVTAGCSGSGESVDELPPANTNSAIAGRTLSCHAGGPPSNLTFGVDGSLSGRLLNEDVTGRWFVNRKGEVNATINAGPISIRDTLRPVGNRWVGGTTTCTG